MHIINSLYNKEVYKLEFIKTTYDVSDFNFMKKIKSFLGNMPKNCIQVKEDEPPHFETPLEFHPSFVLLTFNL